LLPVDKVMEMRHLGPAVLLITTVVGAQMTLTLADGTTTRGSFGGIRADGSWSWQGSGEAVPVPADKVVGLDAGDGAAPVLDDAFRVELATGDSVIGRIEDGSSDDVRLRNPAFGEVTFPLDDVAAIWNLALPRPPESLPQADPKGETLYLETKDGRADYVSGTLEKIGKNQLTFSSSAWQGADRIFSFGRDKVIGVRMAGAAKRAAAPRGRGSILRLKDGSRLTGTLKPSDGATIAIKLDGGPDMSIDSRHLRSLAVVNESLRYLSDVEPAAFAETTLMGGALPQGFRRDSGLKSGQALRIGRRTFAKGLLLPARSRVAWALDGTFARFVATAGVDGAFEGGDLTPSVKITVLLDGKAAWTSAVLRAGAPPENFEVTGLAGAKELAIEVDFGDSFDAGARAVLGNAMLVK
jgi:NPCBM/NEW2 domain